MEPLCKLQRTTNKYHVDFVLYLNLRRTYITNDTKESNSFVIFTNGSKIWILLIGHLGCVNERK